MPRYALTVEEFAVVEKLRRKNERNLGYNEGLDTAIEQVKNLTTTDLNESPEVRNFRRLLAEMIGTLKRELTL